MSRLLRIALVGCGFVLGASAMEGWNRLQEPSQAEISAETIETQHVGAQAFTTSAVGIDIDRLTVQASFDSTKTYTGPVRIVGEPTTRSRKGHYAIQTPCPQLGYCPFATVDTQELSELLDTPVETIQQLFGQGEPRKRPYGVAVPYPQNQ